MQLKYTTLRATPLTLALVLTSACHRSESRKTTVEQPETKPADAGTGNLVSDQDLGLFQVVATPIKGAPLARQVANAAVIDGKVLIWGGSGTGVEPRFASGAMLDPVANEWQPIGDAPLIDTGFSSFGITMHAMLRTLEPFICLTPIPGA